MAIVYAIAEKVRASLSILLVRRLTIWAVKLWTSLLGNQRITRIPLSCHSQVTVHLVTRMRFFLDQRSALANFACLYTLYIYQSCTDIFGRP